MIDTQMLIVFISVEELHKQFVYLIFFCIVQMFYYEDIL